MKDFFIKMLNSTDPLNSKVFAGLICLLIIIAMVVVSFFTKIQMEVFYTICGLCAGCLSLSTFPFKNGNGNINTVSNKSTSTKSIKSVKSTKTNK